MKKKALLKKTDDRKEYKVAKRESVLICTICPPHKGENAKGHRKHGTKKPKYKNKRG